MSPSSFLTHIFGQLTVKIPSKEKKSFQLTVRSWSRLPENLKRISLRSFSTYIKLCDVLFWLFLNFFKRLVIISSFTGRICQRKIQSKALFELCFSLFFPPGRSPSAPEKKFGEEYKETICRGASREPGAPERPGKQTLLCFAGFNVFSVCEILKWRITPNAIDNFRIFPYKSPKRKNWSALPWLCTLVSPHPRTLTAICWRGTLRINSCWVKLRGGGVTVGLNHKGTV